MQSTKTGTGNRASWSKTPSSIPSVGVADALGEDPLEEVRDRRGLRPRVRRDGPVDEARRVSLAPDVALYVEGEALRGGGGGDGGGPREAVVVGVGAADRQKRAFEEAEAHRVFLTVELVTPGAQGAVCYRELNPLTIPLRWSFAAPAATGQQGVRYLRCRVPKWREGPQDGALQLRRSARARWAFAAAVVYQLVSCVRGGCVSTRLISEHG